MTKTQRHHFDAIPRLVGFASQDAVLLAVGRTDLPAFVHVTLVAAPGPWSEALTQRAIATLELWRTNHPTWVGALTTAMETAIHPYGAARALDQLTATMANVDENSRPITRLITVLTLRAAVNAEVSPLLLRTTQEST